MSDNTDTQKELEQVMVAVYQPLKRAEDRLNETKDFNKNHALNHSITYINQELLTFSQFIQFLDAMT